MNQKVKAIFTLRGNRDREELPHCAVLTMPCAVQRSAFSRVAATRAKTWMLLCKIAPSKNNVAYCSFLWAEGVKPVEIHRRMLAQYGQSTMRQRMVYEWVETFKSGRTRVTAEGRSGRPSTSRTQDHKSSRKTSSPQEYRN